MKKATKPKGLGALCRVIHINRPWEMLLEDALDEKLKQCFLKEVKCDLECTSQMCRTHTHTRLLGKSFVLCCRPQTYMQRQQTGVQPSSLLLIESQVCVRSLDPFSSVYGPFIPGILAAGRVSRTITQSYRHSQSKGD